jgi:hypothetical protein
VTSNGASRKVTQIAFPESVNNTVHRSGAYASRGSNPMSNASDMIFADCRRQLLAVRVADVADLPARHSDHQRLDHATAGRGRRTQKL